MSISSLLIDAEKGIASRSFSSGLVHENIGTLNQNGYLNINIRGKTVRVHRLIYFHVYGEIKSGYEVDHINGVRTDNRIINLRLVTKRQNQENRIFCSKNNKLGIKGVLYCKKLDKFKASLTSNRKKFHLGYFETIEEAAKAYQLAAHNYHTHNPSAECLGKQDCAGL